MPTIDIEKRTAPPDQGGEKLRHVYPAGELIAYCGHRRARPGGPKYLGPTPQYCVVCVDLADRY